MWRNDSKSSIFATDLRHGYFYVGVK